MEMPKGRLHRLSLDAISRKKERGLYADGGGLYLQVSKWGTKAWVFRYVSPITQKAVWMGLGALQRVGLPEARKSAATQRGLLERGVDPVSMRKEEKQRKAAEAAKAVTFSQCAKLYVDSHRSDWRSEKHAAQWMYTLTEYAGPVIGALPIQAVDTALVIKVLEREIEAKDGRKGRLWDVLPETASRLRGRIERILSWARIREYRTGDNPACWRG